MPNPDPHEIRFYLAGRADQVTLRLWTPSLILLGQATGGPYSAGWNSLALNPGLGAPMPLGLSYFTIQAEQGSRKSPHRPPGRLVRLH